MNVENGNKPETTAADLVHESIKQNGVLMAQNKELSEKYVLLQQENDALKAKNVNNDEIENIKKENASLKESIVNEIVETDYKINKTNGLEYDKEAEKVHLLTQSAARLTMQRDRSLATYKTIAQHTQQFRNLDSSKPDGYVSTGSAVPTDGQKEALFNHNHVIASMKAQGLPIPDELRSKANGR